MNQYYVVFSAFLCVYTLMKLLSSSLQKLEDRAVSIMGTTAQEAKSLGFSTRVLVQASLPHREPQNDPRAWVRTNGNYSLIIQPGIDRNGASIGFPYGNIPRLVLAYLTTSVVRTRSREIDLGRSLSAFMKDIGLYSNGRDIRRMKEQLQRLFPPVLRSAMMMKRRVLQPVRTVRSRGNFSSGGMTGIRNSRHFFLTLCGWTRSFTVKYWSIRFL